MALGCCKSNVEDNKLENDNKNARTAANRIDEGDAYRAWLRYAPLDTDLAKEYASWCGEIAVEAALIRCWDSPLGSEPAGRPRAIS